MMKSPRSGYRKIFASVFFTGAVACCLYLKTGAKGNGGNHDESSAQSPATIDFRSENTMEQSPAMAAIEIAGEVYELRFDSYAFIADDGTEAVRALQPAASLSTLA